MDFHSDTPEYRRGFLQRQNVPLVFQEIAPKNDRPIDDGLEENRSAPDQA
jgi:hypothetical protein